MYVYCFALAKALTSKVGIATFASSQGYTMFDGWLIRFYRRLRIISEACFKCHILFARDEVIVRIL